MDRFPVLQGISILLKVLAVIILVIGIIGGLLASQQNGGIVSLLGLWVGALIWAIGLWAYSELIGVVLAIEENTRNTYNAVARHP
jgi:hypothetical protein